MSKRVRDVSPFLQKFRDFLLGRQFKTALRYTDNVSTRSPPPPVLPEGPASRLHDNYYCDRDARRLVEPPLVITGGQIQISAKSNAEQSSGKKWPTPGNLYKWD